MKNNKEKQEVQKYLESLNLQDLLSIIKYGLRNSDAPNGVTVEDIYYLIQSISLQ